MMTGVFEWYMANVRSSCLFMATILVGSLTLPSGLNAKSTGHLIAEIAAEQNVQLNKKEITVLRSALPIVSRRYLRKINTITLLKTTMVAMRNYDNAETQPGGKALNRTDAHDKTKKHADAFERVSIALNQGLRRSQRLS